ncbi:helix-turn-helix domain-containing protein [Mesorhizobium sp. YR577]|uniref:sigma-54-dependent Fis family transcriptional regulator n=1 Tax=Mesorhizobium sp. YR577 TaxID=1884373 RepID=UPI0008E02650|nr:helix-turn-helix domain-containing protein [Mesorhizobium sp. YR577]SFU16828.1 Transcriptional regulator of acetoin/glycerol metabolism [Mesorhizobium sp. YR577]
MWNYKTDINPGRDPVMEEIARLSHSRGLDQKVTLPTVVVDSWKRCLADYQLAPDRVPRATVLTHSEMHDLSDTYGDLLSIAGPEVEKLFLRLIDSEYLVSLASPQGVMMLFRCDYQFLGDMSNFGVLPGSVWTEERQGTNGVGTGLRVGKPVTIVGTQHYGAAIQSLTCLTAPVLGKFGAVESILNVTTPRSGDDRTNRVVQDIVERTARRIENRYFDRLHMRNLVLRLSRDRDCADIAEEGRLAINEEGIVTATTSYASTLTGQTAEELIGLSAEEVFELKGGFAPVQPKRPIQLHMNGSAIHATVIQPPSHSERIRAISPTVSARDSDFTPPPIVGRSDQTSEELRLDPMTLMALERAQKLLGAGLPLVVEGETGTGKTTFAHMAARRRFGNDCVIFVVDCAAPSGMSIGSLAAHSIASIASGALILDRLDELDVNGQAELLSVIEDDRQFAQRQVSLISVTSVNLDQLAREGRLRTALLHRLKGGSIELQPLRTSPDLNGVVIDLLELEASKGGSAAVRLEEEARLVLMHYHWPGNVRELRHALRHAVALADSRTIGLDHLPVDIVSEIGRKDLTARSQAEASRIEAALRYNGGNVSLTARHLGVSRATLYRKIQIQKMREEV